MPHHLIFEGAELSGKSFLMSQIYDFLEKKYNESGDILDGCLWFNCDVGIFGTKYGKLCLQKYLEMAKILSAKNILFEKFHLSDKIYHRLFKKEGLDYSAEEKKLKALNFKIVLTTFKEDKKLLQKRIKDRLNLYPHYRRILQNPEFYIQQQQEYLKEIKKSSLPYLIIEMDKMPNKKYKKILKWLGEI